MAKVSDLSEHTKKCFSAVMPKVCMISFYAQNRVWMVSIDVSVVPKVFMISLYSQKLVFVVSIDVSVVPKVFDLNVHTEPCVGCQHRCVGGA